MSVLLQASLKVLWLDILKPTGKAVVCILCSLPILWLLISTIGILPVTIIDSLAQGGKTTPSWFHVNNYVCLGVWIIILIGVVISLIISRIQQRVKEIECAEIHKIYHATGQQCPCMIEKAERQKRRQEEQDSMAGCPW